MCSPWIQHRPVWGPSEKARGRGVPEVSLVGDVACDCALLCTHQDPPSRCVGPPFLCLHRWRVVAPTY